jgi:hypothetical protein
MFEIYTQTHTIAVDCERLPDIYGHYARNAKLSEQLDFDGVGKLCYVAVSVSGDDWPRLVVAQRYSPSEAGFHPGVMVIPEAYIAFIGAGRRLLAYDLKVPRRLWMERSACAFRRWEQSGDIVLMHDEMELAAWTTASQKLWATFADPPWSCRVDGEQVVLSDYQQTRSFLLRSGPRAG